MNPEREWTIAVITTWDDEPPDYLYENIATVVAATAEEAVEKYGADNHYHRDYCTVSARPKGESW